MSLGTRVLMGRRGVTPVGPAPLGHQGPQPPGTSLKQLCEPGYSAMHKVLDLSSDKPLLEYVPHAQSPFSEKAPPYASSHPSSASGLDRHLPLMATLPMPTSTLIPSPIASTIHLPSHNLVRPDRSPAGHPPSWGPCFSRLAHPLLFPYLLPPLPPPPSLHITFGVQLPVTLLPCQILLQYLPPSTCSAGRNWPMMSYTLTEALGLASCPCSVPWLVLLSDNGSDAGVLHTVTPGQWPGAVHTASFRNGTARAGTQVRPTSSLKEAQP